MTILDGFFYANAILALITTLLALSAQNAVHGLLYFVMSVIALALSFYLLDAPLVAALELMVYAGAIMVLFIFVVMLLNIKYHERSTNFKKYLGPLIFALILIVEISVIISEITLQAAHTKIISIKDVAFNLFNNYGIGIEIASLILLSGLIGAFHLGKKRNIL
jgi:NADH-quinone oxidoreductase subunit J